jgi:alkanesulfonate monooxygenase SsuD/methylene tetrahydromethanopterin reductase-like flavin-dependent oxidoreductase (luciferase family)
VQYAVSLPPFGDFWHPRTLAGLARDAEAAGWDAFFIWDHILLWPTPLSDPWISMAAIALATERVKIGPMVTPMPRRRPVKLAREILSLDHLSNGRLIFGAGSGVGPWEYEYLGDEASPKTRAAMLDEALDLLTTLWSGEPQVHHGRFYEFRGDLGPGKPEEAPAPLLPPPAQSPRPPIWLAGTWPLKKPFRRAAQWDGVLPLKAGTDFAGYLTPEDTHAIAAFIAAERTRVDPFALAISGHSSDPSDSGVALAQAQAGATWWIEDISPWPFGWQWEGPWPFDAMSERIRSGPPRVS